MSLKALLVAIDNYGNPRNNLPSCISDLNYIYKLIKDEYGVSDKRIKKLVDSDATINAVTDGIKWLCATSKPDDRLLFFFSGHGYQIPSKGNSLQEVLVLHNNEFFLDDKLVEAFSSAKAGTVTVLLDCCFGGGNEKIFTPSGDFGVVAKPKRWSPPDDFFHTQVADGAVISSYKPFAASLITTLPESLVVLTKSRVSSWPAAVDESSDPELNGVLLAACLEDETATASTPQTDGLSAFTWALSRIISEKGKDVPLRELRNSADRLLKQAGFRQTPTLKVGDKTLDETRIFLTLLPTSGGGNILRRRDMVDKGIVEAVVREIIREMTKSGYQSTPGYTEKFFPGGERLVPVLVNRVIDELTKKGYRTEEEESEKFFPGANIIIPIVVDRVIQEISKKGFKPNHNTADKFFPGADLVIPIIVDRAIDQLTKKNLSSGDGSSDKFFPGADLIVPTIVERVIQELGKR